MNPFSAASARISRLFRSPQQDPVRDWLILLALGCIILACTVVWAMWVFDSASEGHALGTASTSATELLDTSALDTVQSVFSDRAAEAAQYASNTITFTDPSQ